ncbi:MAG: chemotaxis response regulator protein-glutamate methylesterase [Zoogloeaceae bacterium]|jgi:two-component system chemotaxis response regulator CheB|nr:chemotaxis response regulator protein-glutamate methylesterase [Zoogloeaceae bacterium]
MTEKIKVMIVDDSTLVRQVISQMLERDSDIKVIATAPDPIFAQEKMKAEWPDVLILDIEMPRMDGLSFLRQLMSEHPTPTIICSHMAEKGSSVTQEALSIGALSVIGKPQVGVRQFLEETAQEFCRAVHAAAQAAPALKLLPRAAINKESAIARAATLPAAIPADRPKYTADVMLPLSRGALLTPTSERIIAIGTSTGGTQALEKVFTRLPADVLGIVVVQHMPENFTGMFTQRLSSQCKIKVREAQDGDRVRPGLALIAPGGKHMLVKRAGSQFCVEVRDGPHVSRHIPSVDVLFRSVACYVGANALGIIMTGMGDDGATGLKEMHDAGARTIAQDEASCVVFGMPKEAIKLGAADKVMPLARIPDAIVAYSRQKTEDK